MGGSRWTRERNREKRGKWGKGKKGLREFEALVSAQGIDASRE